MSNGLKSGLVLLVLGLAMGALLSLINSLTAPIIADIEEKAQYDALAEFYNIEDYDLSKIEIDDDSVQAIFVLKQNGTIEALVYLVEANGYSSDAPITMLIAVNKDLSVEGYTVVTHKETTGFGADIVNNDFGITDITDLLGFDAVAGVTITSTGIKECFIIVSERVNADFGGGLDD